MNNNQDNFILMLVHGMRCFDIDNDLWYSWLKDKIKEKYTNSYLIFKNLPNPSKCYINEWIPFIKKEIDEAKEKTGYNKIYLVGHSTGAIALMRYMESYKITGAVLVSSYITDLNDERERESGYFPIIKDGIIENDWNWEKMISNAEWIVNIGAEDDKYIPIEEILQVSINLNLKEENSIIFSKDQGMGHFKIKIFPELYDVLIKKIEVN